MQPYLRLQNASVASQLLKVRVIQVDKNCRSTQIVLGKSCAAVQSKSDFEFAKLVRG